MKFSNKQAAIKFIEASGIPIDEKIVLTDIVGKHALDREIVIIGTVDEIQSVLFQSDRDVEEHIELNDIEIDVHSLAGVSSVTNQSKETIMTAQALNEMEAMITASMQKIMESSLDSVLEATLAKQQARIGETVKKSVDEAVKKAVDEALKAKAAEAPKTEAKPEAPKAEEPKSKDESVSIKKIAGYVAATAAVGAGAYLAWKKWGAGSSAE